MGDKMSKRRRAAFKASGKRENYGKVFYKGSRRQGRPKYYDFEGKGRGDEDA